MLLIERFIIKIILFHFSQFLYILSVHEEPFHHQSMKIFPKVGNDSQQEIISRAVTVATDPKERVELLAEGVNSFLNQRFEG